MTQGVLETKGTRLAFVSSSGSPQSILNVACPTGITGLGGAGTQIPTTCLHSQEDEFIRGNKAPGQINVPVNLIPQSRSHQAILALDDSGEVVDWMVLLSDQLTLPTTLDADNHLVSPGPTTVRFQAYVADFNVDIATNEIVRGTMVLQRSGPKQWDLPAPVYD